MHREQRATVFHRAFKALGLILGNPHPNQRSYKATYGPACAYARERRHDGSGSYQWTDTRNCKHPYAGEQSHCPADYSTGGRTRSCAFRRLGALLVRKGARAFVIRQQHRDI